MILTTLGLIFGLSMNAARAADSPEVAELKRKLTAVTAEAEALWIYVESGPDTPNIHALNRAVSLYEKRRRGKH